MKMTKDKVAARTKRSGGTSKKPALTADERREMIEVAAYFKAESRGFQRGDAQQDWLEAEREIDTVFVCR